MLITSVHTKTAVGEKVRNKNTHYVSKDILKKLPQLIEKPVIVMESTTKGSIVMFVNAVDLNNNPVVCAIKVDGKGFYNSVEIESNIVTSVYGKDTNPIGFIKKAVEDNRLLYWDKKMSQELFDIPRLQLPNNIYNFDSNVIIRKINETVKENSDDTKKYSFSGERAVTAGSHDDVGSNADEAVRYSERDFPVDSDVEKTVKSALTTSKGTMHTLSNITSEQNKAINRLVNQSKDDSYRGKYEGGKHKFSDTAIRHIISEHGDFLREGLRAQLPMTATDVARHLSAIKDNKNPSSIKATRTGRGNPSILTSYEVNGYTLYAEEITKSLGNNLPSDLIGHTMYKAPTLATAAFYTTSVQTQPKRQSEVLCNYYMPNSTGLSRYHRTTQSGKLTGMGLQDE